MTSPYLTNAEAAALLRVKPKTLRNRASLGLFREGEHYFKREGFGRRWSREALERWMERGSVPVVSPLAQPGGKKAAGWA